MWPDRPAGTDHPAQVRLRRHRHGRGVPLFLPMAGDGRDAASPALDLVAIMAVLRGIGADARRLIGTVGHQTVGAQRLSSLDHGAVLLLGLFWAPRSQACWLGHTAPAPRRTDQVGLSHTLSGILGRRWRPRAA